MSTIMVLVDNHPDTLAGLHAACTLAQGGRQEIALVQLIPVNQPGWLGTEWGELNYTNKDRRRLEQCQDLVESYGVAVKTYTVQAASTVGGIACAAEQVNARVVFAHLPHALLPLWTRWQASLLRRSLEPRHCQLVLSMPDKRASSPALAHTHSATPN